MGACMKLSGTSNHTPQHEGLVPDNDSDNELGFAETLRADGNNAADVQGPTSKMASNLRCWFTPPRTLELTMFERLEKMYGPGIKCMLTVQYRCVTGLRQTRRLSCLS